MSTDTIHTISRAALVDVIEDAIGCTDMLRTDAIKLMKVAASTEKVAKGDYTVQGVGCPAYQAGLLVPNESPPFGVYTFMMAFDKLMDSQGHVGCCVVRVEG